MSIAPARKRPRRRLPAVAAALAGLVAALLTAPGGAQAAETLVSQNKATTASSSEWAGTPSGAAVDGDNGTRWSSAFAAAQWFQVDLGAPTSVSRIAINWEGAYAKAFT